MQLYDPYIQKLYFFFLSIFRCLYYSIFSHDGTWGNAIITFGTRNRSENENRFIRCLESSESTAGWNRTWLYCSSHDRWLLLQCHYCLVPILPLQLIIGKNNENNLHIILFETIERNCFKNVSSAVGSSNVKNQVRTYVVYPNEFCTVFLFVLWPLSHRKHKKDQQQKPKNKHTV